MNTLIKNKFARVIMPVIAILFFLSCQKNLDYVSINGQSADLTTKVTSTVSGFVTDENNAAVMSASVTVGGIMTNTDKYGFFQVKNVQVVKNAATVIVNKPGYFKGIKTYIAENNKAAFFRIKLIPKTNAGSISATAGGSVTLSNGLIIALPANAVVNAASSVAYTGQVNVAAHWIDPTATDLTESMPGDLRGIATDGSLKLLTTYGMAAVELTGASGELLQIAAGKKATLTFTIPASIMASAPSTIPLWSFDETSGLWKQEGTATKTGNTYVGDVSHFSFWNCDLPANYVQFNCTVKDQSGNPISNAWVKVTDLATNVYRWGITDSSGYVAGAVPDNASLLLEIYIGYYCGTPVYSQNFTTASTNISLGDILVSASSSVATISGTVTDCSNNPVTNGRIIVQENGGYYYFAYPISNTGSFSFSRLLCNGSSTINIIAEDLAASQQSSPVTVALVAGANVLGNLQACGISTQEFITYSVDGGTTSTTMTAPVDSVFQTGNGSNLQYLIYGYSSGNSNSVSFSFDNTGIGVGSTQNLLSFYSTQSGQGTTTDTVHITEYGAVGQFIGGNITGAVVTAPPITTYNIVCSFRVRRTF